VDPRYFPSVYPDYERLKSQLREQLDLGTINRLVDERRALAADGMDRIIESALEKS